jgi:hypothetical protein
MIILISLKETRNSHVHKYNLKNQMIKIINIMIISEMTKKMLNKVITYLKNFQ